MRFLTLATCLVLFLPRPAPANDEPPRPTRTPSLRTVDLAVGESRSVELADGEAATVKKPGFGDGSPTPEVRSDGDANPRSKDGYAVTPHPLRAPGHYLVRVERSDRRGVKATARLYVIVEEGRRDPRPRLPSGARHRAGS